VMGNEETAIGDVSAAVLGCSPARMRAESAESSSSGHPDPMAVSSASRASISFAFALSIRRFRDSDRPRSTIHFRCRFRCVVLRSDGLRLPRLRFPQRAVSHITSTAFLYAIPPFSSTLPRSGKSAPLDRCTNCRGRDWFVPLSPQSDSANDRSDGCRQPTLPANVP
jgi:hypothetical protein